MFKSVKHVFMGLLVAMFIQPVFAADKSSAAQAFSVWLIPQGKDRSYFSQQIDQFAERYQAQKFQPHVTIYWGNTMSLDRVKQTIQSMASQSKPIELVVDRIGATPEKFQTLFVAFKNDDRLLRWSKRIGEQALKDDYSLHLHLSLLYQDMPIQEKEKLAKQLRLPMATVRFDQIELIREDDPDDVTKWISIYTWKLKE